MLAIEFKISFLPSFWPILRRRVYFTFMVIYLLDMSASEDMSKK